MLIRILAGCLRPCRLRLVPLLLLPVGGLAAAATTLSYQDALDMALRDSPALSSTAAREEAARSAAIPAGALPDPSLTLGLENLPASGTDRFSLDNDFMTMRRIGVMQEFPNRAKRDARVEDARAEIAGAEARSRSTRLGVLRTTAIAWIERYTAERQLAQVPALRASNRLFAETVNARLGAGQGTAADALVPRTEAAMIEAQADQLEEQRARAIATLRPLVGEAAEAALEGVPPELPVSRETLLGTLAQHPEFGEFDAMGRVLDARIAAARADRKPDWSLGVSYGQRDRPYGDMVSLELRLGLPVFTRSRQDPVIAARLAERTGLDAEREATEREHAAEIEADLATHQRLGRAIGRQRTVLLPLAEDRIALAEAAWAGGRGSLVDLVSARRERIDAGITLIELEGERQALAAKLHYAYAEHPGAQP